MPWIKGQIKPIAKATTIGPIKTGAIRRIGLRIKSLPTAPALGLCFMLQHPLKMYFYKGTAHASCGGRRDIV
jgi:hypothetical protein